MALFPYVLVEHLSRAFSDHCAIGITFDNINLQDTRQVSRPFRFEEFWCREHNCSDIVALGWDAGNTVVDKINNVTALLKEAKFHTTGSIRKKIKHLEESLDILKNLDLTDAVKKNIQTTQLELDQLRKNEEILWRQRSRAVWLKEGDLNTKFFHRKANQRRNRNTIRRIRDEHNIFHSDSNGLVNTITSYFLELFKASNLEGVEEVCKGIKLKLNEEQCAFLSKPYCQIEVKDALDSMHPSKAPGPDGITALFFQKFWSTVGVDVSTTVLQILNDDLICHDSRSWNSSRVEELFLPFEAKIILSIPLSWRNVEDRLLWPLEKHGNYSVRSAYHLIISQDSNTPSSVTHGDPRWKKLWGLTLPPKVKVFFWKLCHGAIASNLKNIQRRGVHCDASCFNCCDKVESISHLFLLCPMAKELWFSSPLGFFPILTNQEAFLDWLWDRIARESEDTLCLIVMICWTIWQRSQCPCLRAKMWDLYGIWALEPHKLASSWGITLTKVWPSITKLQSCVLGGLLSCLDLVSGLWWNFMNPITRLNFKMSLPKDPHRPFFPFGNPFRMILPKGSRASPQLLAILSTFEVTLAERIRKLMPKNKNEILTLSWMTSAMESLCETHNDIKSVITDLELPVCDWDEKWTDVYLDISVKLLDLCIAFSSELSRLNQGNLLLQCALHNLDSASSKQFVRASSSLDGWRQHINSRNHRILKCGSILDNLVGSLDLPKVKNSAKGKVLMRAMYGVKVFTVLVCSVFAAAFSGSEKKLLDLDIPDTYSWAPAFTSLQNFVNEEIRVIFSSGRFTLFKDLEAVDALVKEFHPTIQGGVDTIETESFRKFVEDLGSAEGKLSQGLDLLAKGVDGFFKVVLNGRDALLANLRLIPAGGIVNQQVVR
ncbi:protein BPS1, chloroplastic-like [Senna tora]|uniref:Protein BPS1, chloroplastic-like n=1 Tax=Senna tora TaxID=362788 RepID=A0A834XFZ7_9FABA|nr:protein BPS1, chloroplastic-like [Senna tora]